MASAGWLESVVMSSLPLADVVPVAVEPSDAVESADSAPVVAVSVDGVESFD